VTRHGELETRIAKARAALGALAALVRDGADRAIVIAKLLKIGAELVELALEEAPKAARKEETR
jgi:hypothetical protein